MVARSSASSRGARCNGRVVERAAAARRVQDANRDATGTSATASSSGARAASTTRGSAHITGAASLAVFSFTALAAVAGPAARQGAFRDGDVALVDCNDDTRTSTSSTEAGGTAATSGSSTATTLASKGRFSTATASSLANRSIISSRT